MFKLAALNQQTDDDSSIATKSTKEAQEARAFDLYNEALRLQQANQHDEAVVVYEELLKTSLVAEAAISCVDEHGESKSHPLKHPGLILKYSSHKNMANIAAIKNDMQTAIEHYLQAVVLDTSDVTLWFKIGHIAINMFKLPLARYAFTQGLECNENHWPCLNLLITVLFATMDYEYCLLWISRALDKEPNFKKGIVLRSKMIRDCPHLKQDTSHMFEHCEGVNWDVNLNHPSSCEIIKEAMHYRIGQRKLNVRPKSPEVLLKTSSKVLSWLKLGESLLESYKKIMDDKTQSSLTSRVILPDIELCDSSEEILPTQPTTGEAKSPQTGMEVDLAMGGDDKQGNMLSLNTDFNLEELNMEMEEHCDILDRESVKDFGDLENDDVANMDDVEDIVVDRFEMNTEMSFADASIKYVEGGNIDEFQPAKEKKQNHSEVSEGHNKEEQDIPDVVKEIIDSLVNEIVRNDKSLFSLSKIFDVDVSFANQTTDVNVIKDVKVVIKTMLDKIAMKPKLNCESISSENFERNSTTDDIRAVQKPLYLKDEIEYSMFNVEDISMNDEHSTKAADSVELKSVKDNDPNKTDSVCKVDSTIANLQDHMSSQSASLNVNEDIEANSDANIDSLLYNAVEESEIESVNDNFDINRKSAHLQTDNGTEISVENEVANLLHSICGQVVNEESLHEQTHNIAFKKNEKGSAENIIEQLLNDICDKVVDQNDTMDTTNDFKEPFDITVDKSVVDISQTSQSSIDEEVLTQSSLVSVSNPQKKKKSKRKRDWLEELDYESKRRSSRTRKPTGQKKKKPLFMETIQIAEPEPQQLLMAYLPGCLQMRTMTPSNFDSDSQSSQDSMSQDEGDTSKPNVTPKVKPVCNDVEPDKLKSFINNNAINHGIVDTMRRYCTSLAMLVHMRWPLNTRDVIAKMYSFIQEHTINPSLEDEDLENETKREVILCMLACMEAQIDVATEASNKNPKERKKYMNRYFHNCLFELACAVDHPEIFANNGHIMYTWNGFVTRFYWLRSKHYTLQRVHSAAINDINICKEYLLKISPEDSEKVEMYLPNLKHDNVISITYADVRLESFKKDETIDSLKHLCEIGKFDDVVSKVTSLLKVDQGQIFRESCCQISIEPIREKHQLLQMLVNASAKITDVKKQVDYASYVTSEAEYGIRCVHNTMEKTLVTEKSQNSAENSPKSTWKIILKEWQGILWQAIRLIESLINEDSTALTHLSQHRLGILALSLVKMNQDSMSQGRSIYDSDAKANRFSSWILLYRIVKHCEPTEPCSNVPTTDDDDVPGSLNILCTAHETFGDKGNCCSRHGRFLKFYSTVLMNELYPSESAICQYGDTTKQHIQEELEQCFFCMFGYPSKLSKNSFIMDHNSKQLSMSWSNGCMLYKYFSPSELPSYNSYKQISMTNDLAHLLVRIIKLIPADVQKNFPSSVDKITKYIRTGKAEYLEVESTNSEDPAVEFRTKDIYYLLADYYFKNKEMGKAIHYYLLDLSANTERFDAWASIALAKSSEVDVKMRNCEAKKHGSILDKNGDSIVTDTESAMHCFKRALAIDGTGATIWIEYGTLAYCLHSYYSRLLNSKSLDGSLSSEIADDLTKKRSSLLDISQKSFESALKCEEEEEISEEWLIRYMLGKIAEKKRSSCEVYLHHYTRAMTMLHIKNAKYPKKIHFKSYQSDYAIEALEVYFRVHACIIKLVQNEINVLEGYEYDFKWKKPYKQPLTNKDYKLFEDVLDEFADSPFVQRDTLATSQSSDSRLMSQASPCKLTAVTPSMTLSMGSLVPDVIADTIERHCKVETKKSIELSESPETSQEQSENEVSQKSVTEEKLDRMNILSDTEVTLTTAQRISKCVSVMNRCVTALKLCLQRFPQHYKSLYRLAHLYLHMPENWRHVNWSCDLLFNSSEPWQKQSHMPAQGLLAEKNKTNIFNGVWKIPVDEIDRPGSFASHLHRSIMLLLEIFYQMKDHKQLLYMHSMLCKNPDAGRKYLRDSDRILSAKIALRYNVKIIREKLYIVKVKRTKEIQSKLNQNKLNLYSNSSILPGSAANQLLTLAKISQVEQQKMENDDGVTSTREDTKYNNAKESSIKTPDNTDQSHSLLLLMDAFATYKQSIKTKKTDSSASTPQHKELLIDAYKNYKQSANCTNEAQSTPTIERIIQFCQQQQMLNKKANAAVSNTTAKTSDVFSAKQKNATAEIQHGEIESTTSKENLPTAENSQISSTTNASNGETTNTTEEKSADRGEVMMVKSGQQTYTKVTMVRKNFRTSPTSAFTPTHKLEDEDALSEMRAKRLKEDPHLKHLKISSNGNKAPLIRSSSMPVPSFSDDLANAGGNSQIGQTFPSRIHQHRAIYRTGSVSDATKQKLKSAILLRTSAALVRKPSITEQEIRHITNDVDSSQSDDEDEMDDNSIIAETTEVKFGSTEHELPLAPATEAPPIILTMTTT